MSRYVGELLRQRIQDARQYEIAMRRALARKPVRLRSDDQPYPKREDLYDRPVFVDTNILLYKIDETEPVKQSRAAEWIHQLWRERAGRTSLQALCEFYVNATRKLKPGMSREDAWDEVEGYLTCGASRRRCGRGPAGSRD